MTTDTDTIPHPPLIHERWQRLAEHLFVSAARELAKAPDSEAGLDAEAFLLDDTSPWHALLGLDAEEVYHRFVRPILRGKPVRRVGAGVGAARKEAAG